MKRVFLSLFCVFCFFGGIYLDHVYRHVPQKIQDNPSVNTIVSGELGKVTDSLKTILSPGDISSYMGQWKQEKDYITYDNDLHQAEKNTALNDYIYTFMQDMLTICEIEATPGNISTGVKTCQKPEKYSTKNDIIDFDDKKNSRYKWSIKNNKLQLIFESQENNTWSDQSVLTFIRQ